jgi:hypothetical protein
MQRGRRPKGLGLDISRIRQFERIVANKSIPVEKKMAQILVVSKYHRQTLEGSKKSMQKVCAKYGLDPTYDIAQAQSVLRRRGHSERRVEKITQTFALLKAQINHSSEVVEEMKKLLGE